MILSAQVLAVGHIDENYVLTSWTLSRIMTRALLPPSSDPKQAKFARRLLDKLKTPSLLLHLLLQVRLSPAVSPAPLLATHCSQPHASPRSGSLPTSHRFHTRPPQMDSGGKRAHLWARYPLTASRATRVVALAPTLLTCPRLPAPCATT